MVDDISAAASRFLLDLAHGKYDYDIGEADKILSALAEVVPWAGTIKQAMDILLMINKATAPISVVSDGHGGYVPATNSRYDPKTGRFI